MHGKAQARTVERVTDSTVTEGFSASVSRPLPCVLCTVDNIFEKIGKN